MDICASQAREGRAWADFERHDGFVDDDRCNRQWLGSGVLDMQLDHVPFQMVALDGQVFDRNRCFEIEPAAGGKEKRNHSGQENDRNEEQNERLKGETF